MKSQYLLVPLKLLPTKLLMIILSFFLLTAFSWLILPEGNFFSYSVITTLFYVVALILAGHDNGRKDGRTISTTPPFAAKGFLIALISESISLLLLIFLIIFRKTAEFWVYNLVFCLINAPFFGFFGIDMALMKTFKNIVDLNYAYFVPAILVVLSYGFGYIAGYKVPDLFEKAFMKINYKKK